MISKKEIARIKIAQKNAGVNDETYRIILSETSGVLSCKNLEPYQVPDVLQAIKNLGQKRPGWKARQLDKFRQYAKFAEMTPKESRIFLSNTLNIAVQEEDPNLTNKQFDLVMAELEAELELRITQGDVAKPAKIKLTYWRERKPISGESNTRETHKVWEVWFKLCPWMNEEKRKVSYLLGIATKCCHKQITDISQMSAREAWFVIEALKLKLKQEKETMAKEVPF